MSDFWQQFFSFLKELLPAITTFFMGKKLGEIGAAKLEQENIDLRLKLSLAENAEKVRIANAGKSDADILRDVTGSGDVPKPK